MDATYSTLTAADASALSELLLRQEAGYLAHFTPFPFDLESISSRIEAAKKDQYWALRYKNEIAEFFMLRGFDEGYERPAFGVFVAKEFAGRGLGRLALQESLRWCRERGVKVVMLKAHPENIHACRLYESEGFEKTGVCERTGHTMMEARLQN